LGLRRRCPVCVSMRPLAETMECFLASNTYKLLSDKETGLYWDSLDETYGMFMREMRLQCMSGGSGIDRNAPNRRFGVKTMKRGEPPAAGGGAGGDCPAEKYSAPPLGLNKKIGIRCRYAGLLPSRVSFYAQAGLDERS
jgi:hypothetical protein